MFERRIRRGRLFGQYGGVGIIAKRHRPTLMRKGPRRRSNFRPKKVPTRGSKVSKQVHKRRRRSRAPKKGLHSLVAEGREALKQGLTHGKKSIKRRIKRAMRKMPNTMVEAAKAAGEAVAPTVAKAASKGLKNVRKRFTVDKNMISPAQLPIKRAPKLKGRRRVQTTMPSHVTNMSIKRGGYLF